MTSLTPWCHDVPMRRMQVQIDEETYARLRRLAFERQRSMASLVRETLEEAYRTTKPRPKLTLADFSFVGAGRSVQGAEAPVSERHDEAFVQAIEERLKLP